MIKNNKTSPKNQKTNSRDSFLEAFRDLGGDFVSTAKDDLVKKGAQDIFKSFFPAGNRSDQESPSSLSSLPDKDLERTYLPRLQRAEILRREEKILFTQQERKTQQQVKTLQEEIKELAKATGNLAKEAQVVAFQEVPLAGTYHINFFEKLIKLIKSLKTQIEQSSLWLSAWNKKAKKRNIYWGQFKKSGSKYLLSADRYMATQAG